VKEPSYARDGASFSPVERAVLRPPAAAPGLVRLAAAFLAASAN